ncbi:ATP-binding protein [Nocardiopsis sp. CC223A]|uniref:ATP-binding protein n=1 Tax=Nocardiopsis sp. CC223A TaxID=3044051 RepID=UPI00278C0A49|nr:ATP-binding protein [Nocardiopsis sp. CC223A]
MQLNQISDVTGSAIVVQLRDVHGSVHLTAAPGPQPPLSPRQLPPHQLFVDREHARAHLDRAWDTRHGTCWVAIEGAPGIGKTALVVDWWHRHPDRWPDGAVYTDLSRTSSDTTLRRWCAALGHALPGDPGQAVELWRTLTYHRRLLVVVDNADPGRADEVQDLLPAGAGCAGVVIGTHGWTRLVARGGRLVRLSPLDTGTVSGLIARLVDRPLPSATLDAAAAAAGGSPLLAGLHACLLALAHPDDTETLSMPDTVERALDLLPEDTVRAAAQLAAHPGPHLSADLAAALWNMPSAQAVAVLGTLTVARIVTDLGDHRYTLPGPVRVALGRRLADTDRAQTIDRVARFYRLRVAAADLALNTWRWRADEQGLEEAEQAQQAEEKVWFSTKGAAMVWLDDELDNVVALAGLLAEEVRVELWYIAEHIATYVNHRKPWAAATVLYRLGMEAALACGDQVAIALMHQRAAVITADPDDRRAHLEAALDTYRAADHPEGVCSAEQSLADHLNRGPGRCGGAVLRLAGGAPGDRTGPRSRAHPPQTRREPGSDGPHGRSRHRLRRRPPYPLGFGIPGHLPGHPDGAGPAPDADPHAPGARHRTGAGDAGAADTAPGPHG